ncbi:hypothetical protein NSQ91_31920 [Paenibacillus sp. FSL R7-0048]|uniref:hypothetical protein n=1 Tax=Paenibacillus sp. FSL R7-0048 TaxID=2954528 RepID=UPI0030F4DAE9
MTRRQEIECEIARLASEITDESTLLEQVQNMKQRQNLYTEWLREPDLPDLDFMKHQRR